jgi:hypothetical protein
VLISRENTDFSFHRRYNIVYQYYNSLDKFSYRSIILQKNRDEKQVTAKQEMMIRRRDDLLV